MFNMHPKLIPSFKKTLRQQKIERRKLHDKFCSLCGEFDEDLIFFGGRYYCGICYVNKDNYFQTIKAKICKECGQMKPLEEFHKNKRKKDGKTSKCKECLKKYTQKLKDKNNEKNNNNNYDNDM